MVKAMLGIAILSEIALLVYCFVRKSRARLEARIWCLAQAAAIALYYLMSPHSMNFQWFSLFLLMAIFILFGTFGLIKYLRRKDEALQEGQGHRQNDPQKLPLVLRFCPAAHLPAL